MTDTVWYRFQSTSTFLRPECVPVSRRLASRARLTRFALQVAAVILLFCLNVPRKQGKTAKQHAREFDFIGLTLIVGGVASLLVGLNNGEKSWGRVDTYVPLAIGVVAIVLGAINEIFTKQSPVVPPRLFKTRTTAAILGLAFFHGIVFFSGA